MRRDPPVAPRARSPAPHAARARPSGRQRPHPSPSHDPPSRTPLPHRCPRASAICAAQITPSAPASSSTRAPSPRSASSTSGTCRCRASRSSPRSPPPRAPYPAGGRARYPRRRTSGPPRFASSWRTARRAPPPPGSAASSPAPTCPSPSGRATTIPRPATWAAWAEARCCSLTRATPPGCSPRALSRAASHHPPGLPHLRPRRGSRCRACPRLHRRPRRPQSSLLPPRGRPPPPPWCPPGWSCGALCLCSGAQLGLHAGSSSPFGIEGAESRPWRTKGGSANRR